MFKGKLMTVTLILMAVLALGIVGCGPAEEPTATVGDIVGIDPGAGIMAATEEALEVYDLEVGLIEGSDAAMTAELSTAIANEEWVIVTGWAPHWKFAEWDLKFLEDPELVYGGEEYIASVSRLDLVDDYPDVHEFLQNFYWDDAEIGAVMDMNAEEPEFLANAQTWIEDNRDLVDGWIPEDLEGDGEAIEILMVEWDCATASTYVVSAILQEAGYEVEVTAVDAGVMWSSIAEGDADFFTTAWLPGTHEAYMDEFGDDVDEVGTNYEGAQIGLVVPAYVGFDSIAEINDYAD